MNSFSKPKTLSTNEAGLPSEPSTTGLSPYLSTGCLSPRVLWNEVTAANLGSKHTKPPTSLHGQLMFREMFHLLSRSVNNWDDDKGNSNCKPIEWGQSDPEALYAWESGMTGFPLIDAMMRQLSTTGWMHHLGRHAVSCFAVFHFRAAGDQSPSTATAPNRALRIVQRSPRNPSHQIARQYACSSSASPPSGVSAA